MSNLKTNLLPSMIRTPNRLGVWIMLLGLICLFIPPAVLAALSFYMPSESLSWSDLKPDRPEAIAPVINLCGEWQYRAGDKFGTITVPSSYAGYDGKITFSRQFTIPDDWRGESLSLIFFGISHQASFRLNGALLGSHQSSGVPFEISIPEQIIRFGSSNELVVEVDNRKSSVRNLPLKSSVFAPRNFGGITREVFLQALPLERINSLCIEEKQTRTSAPESDPGNDIVLEVALSLLIGGEYGSGVLTVELYGPDGNRILRREASLEAVQADKLHEETFSLAVPQPRRWRPGEPCLYRLVCRLSRGRELLDQVQKSFGLRSWRNADRSLVDPDAFLAEFGPLHGVIKVEQWPQSGFSPSPRQMEAEIELIQDLGVDFLRCAFFPPHPYFITLCDSLGIALFVEIPLFGVSERMLSKREVQTSALAAMKDLQYLARFHPCITALGWGSGFEPSAVSAGGIIGTWVDDLPSDIPYYAHSIGAVSNPASLLIVAPAADTDSAPIGVIRDISASIGPFTGTQGGLEQAHRLSRELCQLPERESSFFVSYLNDWSGDRPLIYNPTLMGSYIHAAGLADAASRPRIAFLNLKEYLLSGEIDEKDYPEKSAEEPPWEFLAFGIVFSALWLWVMRVDKLFRQNLRRSLAHSHGFIGEIRDRRFLQGYQTLLLLIFLCTGIGNLWASLGYGWRLQPGFSALMEHLVGSDTLLAFLRTVIWVPYQGFLFASLAVFVASLIMTVVVRIGSSRQPTRLSLIQSISVLLWSAVPALIILPLSALYLRLQILPALHWMIMFVILWVLAWSYLRLINSLSISYRSGFKRPLMVGVGLPLLLLISYVIRLQLTRQSLDYIGYFFHLFSLG